MSRWSADWFNPDSLYVTMNTEQPTSLDLKLRSLTHPAEYVIIGLLLPPSGVSVQLRVYSLTINRIALICLVRRQLTALSHVPVTDLKPPHSSVVYPLRAVSSPHMQSAHTRFWKGLFSHFKWSNSGISCKLCPAADLKECWLFSVHV